MSAVLSREEMVYMAKLGEQSERYEDMANYMKEVAKMGDELNIEERNLLSVAYKNVVGSRRNAWRIVGSISQKHEQKNSGSKSEITEMVKKNIENELRTTCNDLLDLIEAVLLPRAHVAETKVFVLKMKGDYFRYLAEFSTDKERDTAAEKSLAAYKEATEIAKSFSCTDPMLLGLALNFSVFYYEIMNSPDQACKIAKTAFDEAVAGLDNLPEDSYKDSTLIMQLLRDNITLWTADNVEEAEGDAHVNTTVLPKAE